MSWTVYWFMLPVCLVIASVAMFSGISGAAMLTPVFLIGFPLFNIPRLTTLAAIGTSLFLETSGFGTGLYRYICMRLVDGRTARALILITLPMAVVGSVAARHVPGEALKIGYGIAMLALAWVLISDRPAPDPAPAMIASDPGSGRAGSVSGARPTAGLVTAAEMRPAVVSQSESAHPACGAGEPRLIRAASGRTYSYCAHGLGLQRILSGGGAVLAGMISTGVGEATLPALVRRSRFPVAVAAATSTVVVAGTVAGATVTHFVELIQEGGLGAIPWNLIVYAVPGSITGAFLGTRLQGRVSEGASRLFFSALFAAIGLAFLLAFTVFHNAFK